MKFDRKIEVNTKTSQFLMGQRIREAIIETFYIIYTCVKIMFHVL